MSVTLQKIVEDSLTYSEEGIKEGKLGNHSVKVLFDTEHPLLKEIINFDHAHIFNSVLYKAEKNGRTFLREWTLTAGAMTMVIMPSSTCVDNEEDMFDQAFMALTYLGGLHIVQRLFNTFISPSSERIQMYDLCCKIERLEFDNLKTITNKETLIKKVKDEIENHELPRYLGETFLNTIEQSSLAKAKRLLTILMIAYPKIGIDPLEAEVLDSISTLKSEPSPKEPKIIRLISKAFLNETAQEFFNDLMSKMSDEQIINLVHSTYDQDGLLDLPLDRKRALELICNAE